MYPFYCNYTTKHLLNASIQSLKPNSTNILSIEEDTWQHFISNNKSSVSFAYLFFTQLGTLDCFINVIFMLLIYMIFICKYK